MKSFASFPNALKSFRSASFVLLTTCCLVSFAGCGEKAGAVADQDEMAEYLEANPELKETNSEEPDLQREGSIRAAPEQV
ncbi:secreted protein [Rhodopirellula maiorica SM1]|uniref:Secreted protein n=1 Tax=Rhodopirellula maiorica SM1 TaxID=1265738 RepID=M5RFD9_9BACT|nr:secreted protein [Rhodopirellula maiorica]EMI17791.1 secreted protein [Rhodopirellula maiorica SM1]